MGYHEVDNTTLIEGVSGGAECKSPSMMHSHRGSGQNPSEQEKLQRLPLFSISSTPETQPDDAGEIGASSSVLGSRCLVANIHAYHEKVSISWAVIFVMYKDYDAIAEWESVSGKIV